MRPSLSWIPACILALSLIVTAVATHYVAETINAKDQVRFEGAVDTIQDHMQSRLSTYVALLQATRGFYVAAGALTAPEFTRFVDKLHLREQYPGVQGIGFAMRIRQDDISETEAKLQAQGLKEFRVWPVTGGDEYYPVTFLEPRDRRNVAALGYDMFHEPIRREAMVNARDTGVAAMTGRVTLVQEIDEDKQAGFLIYVPVYKNGSSPKSLEKRREEIVGFVYSPCRAGDMLGEIVTKRESRELYYEAYDGAELTPTNLLYASQRSDEDAGQAPRFSRTIHVPAARRTWSIHFSSSKQFEMQSDRQLIPLTAGSGVIGSLLLFALTYGQARARATAEDAAEQLKVSRQEAETANRLKDQFLATVSHELRTPLNAITGWAHLLKEESGLDDETRKGLDVIERNAMHQAELVDELLDVSRIISGRLRIEVEPIDFLAVVRSAIETVGPAADAKRVEIEEDFEIDDASMSGDFGRLQQVIWNLLSNAIKFTRAGGRVSVSVSRAGSLLRLRVTDTGRGISPDFLPFVFNAFRQAESSSTRRHGGLGLGLAIVHHLVELHGGTIVAESEGEGRGATFTATLPIRAQAAGSPAVAAPAPGLKIPQIPDASGDLDGVKVLVVDDEEDARELLVKLLSQRRAVAVSAATAEDALCRFREDRPDVVVSDIGMPGKDGYEFIRELRALEDSKVRVPAIALTAFAGVADRERALAAGYDAHLAKPIDPDRLAATVNFLTRGSE